MAKSRTSHTPKKVQRKPAAVRQDFSRALEQAKLDALKELAYGASHEINNPLANIATRAQTLLQLESDPEKRRMLASIHVQAMRAHEMIADLMLFSRPPAIVRSHFDLVDLLRRIVAEMSPRAREQGTQIVLSAANFHLSSPSQREGATRRIEVDADATQLAVAVRALVQNSVEAIAGAGRIDISVSATKSHATITVGDNGPGIPVEIRSHIFEPFYSGREAGRGLGFGLSKCWRIVTDHGGSIIVDDGPSGGTTVTVKLPTRGRRTDEVGS